MLKQAIAGLLIGSSGIWPVMSLLSLSPASFLYGGGSGLSLLTPIIGGIFGLILLKGLRGFAFGVILGFLLNLIPLALSFVFYHDFWTLNINLGFLPINLVTGIIGMITTPYLFNKFSNK